MKYLKYILPVLLTVSLSSCKDFLEPHSESEFIPTTAQDLNEMLLGQSYMSNSGAERIVGIMPLYDDDVTTNPVAYQRKSTGEDPYEPLAKLLSGYTWQYNYSRLMYDEGETRYRIYSTHYELIIGTNAALDIIDEVEGLPQEIDYVKAQAHALRAYYYFRLANIYGYPYNYDKTSLAVPLKLNAVVENKELKRNTVEEVYEQVVSDLLEAEKAYLRLPAEQQWRPNYRTSLPMVQLLLSRVYLYMENWEQAAKYAAMVMDNPNFSLFDLNSLGDPTPNAPYYNLISYENSPECIWVFGSTNDIASMGSIRISPDDYDIEPRYFLASESFLSTFETGDERRYWYMVSEVGEGWEPHVPAPGEVRNPKKDKVTYWRTYGKIAIQNNDGLDPSGSNNFGMAFRLSEAYLNFAEANAMLNLGGNSTGVADAIRAIDELRAARIVPDHYSPIPAMSAADFVQFVRDERRRELCFEDHRWYDLRRYGMPRLEHVYNAYGVASKYVLEKNDPGYALDIPFEAYERNGSLVHNPWFPERTAQ